MFGVSFRQEVVKRAVTFLIIILASIFAYLVTPVFDKASAIWNSPSQLIVLQETQQQILRQLQILSGEDRVIRQPEGLSYVKEPVSFGDQEIEIFYVIGRTDSGAGCSVISGRPIFSDSVARLPVEGELVTSVRNPSGPVDDFLITVRPPQRLHPGRVEVYIILEYECPVEPEEKDSAPIFVTRFDRTDVLVYQLLEEADETN